MKKECQFCGDEFHPQSLNRHQNSFHRDEMDHHCPECGQGFMDESYLRKHLTEMHGISSSKEMVECAVCEKEFEGWKYRERKICGDKDCLGEFTRIHNSGEDGPNWRGGGINYNCDYCGDDITLDRCLFEEFDNHFCDEWCYADWQSENRVGENHHQWQGGGVEYYGTGWSNIRKERIEMDNGECRVCGIDRDTHQDKFGRDLAVHHIIPRREFYDEEDEMYDEKEMNDLNNLISLCDKHHIKVERGVINLGEKMVNP